MLAVRFVHPLYLSVCLAMLCSIAVLKLFDLHIPPALAIGIIPFVIEKPDIRYAASVLGGTVLLTLSFLTYRGCRRRMKPHESAYLRRGSTDLIPTSIPLGS